MVRTSLDSERGRLVRRLSTLTAAAVALFPRVAHADNPSLGAGLFVGYTFGPRHGIEWGLEAFATHRFRNESCSSDEPRSGMGPLLQFGMIGLRDPRLTVAVQGGTEIARFVWAVSGELGATYRFGGQPGFGIHTGLSTEMTFFNAAGRYQWLLDDAWVGAGARVQPTYGDQARCVAGRPLRTENGPARFYASWRRNAHHSRGRGAARASAASAGQAWERDAQQECASVLAFLHLAEELLVQDAPARLIDGALDAARDEMRHAALCARLASRYLGSDVWPALPRVARRTDLPAEDALVRFAVESWVDGVIAEGAAARRAERAAALATHREARAVQRVVARDEARHADLGWKILRWAILHGGVPVSDAVRAVAADDVVEFGSCDPCSALEQHGRLPAAEGERLFSAHLAACRHRLDRVLSRGSSR